MEDPRVHRITSHYLMIHIRAPDRFALVWMVLYHTHRITSQPSIEQIRDRRIPQWRVGCRRYSDVCRRSANPQWHRITQHHIHHHIRTSERFALLYHTTSQHSTSEHRTNSRSCGRPLPHCTLLFFHRLVGSRSVDAAVDPFLYNSRVKFCEEQSRSIVEILLFH